MQQILTSTPSESNIHQSSVIASKITANPCLQKKFFTIEKIMAFIFFVVFITYQVFSKKIFFKEIHIPLHATHFNISYNEEKMLIAEVEEDLWRNIYKLFLEFIIAVFLFAYLILLLKGHKYYTFLIFCFVVDIFFLSCLYKHRYTDLTCNQEKAFIFKNDLKNLLEKIQKYPTSRNKNSILSINIYNREVDSYNRNIQEIEDFLKKEKNYFKNYVIAQALINLNQEKFNMKYVKDAADYFIETPADKLEFSPRGDVVFSIELKAYGKAISPLAREYQLSIR